MSDIEEILAENRMLKKKLRAIILCRAHEKKQIKRLKKQVAQLSADKPSLLTTEDMKKLIS